MQENDEALVTRAARGDAQALHTLLDRHAAGLFRLAYGLVGNRADAEDVLQEAFLGAVRAIGSFEGRSSVRTWLGQIVFRQAAALRRSRAVRRTVALAPDPMEPPGAETGTAQVDRREDVLATVGRLAPDHREVIVLREFEQMSYEEIAALLGVPRGTVESRLHRARRELRAMLAGYES